MTQMTQIKPSNFDIGRKGIPPFQLGANRNMLLSQCCVTCCSVASKTSLFTGLSNIVRS